MKSSPGQLKEEKAPIFKPNQKRPADILFCISVLALALIVLLSIQYVKARASINPRSSGQVSIERTRLSEQVSVQAAGRGNPYINLTDGHELVTSYKGPEALTRALENNEVRGLSLASGDFDEDGVPDLISGYASAGAGGIITIMRGNVDSIHPNAPEAKQRKEEGTFTDAPFLSPARVLEVPASADFIGAGDFDADGHLDIVSAAKGEHRLYVFAGDGEGKFAEPKTIELEGEVTTLITGEINRRDGLTDVIVAVKGNDGAKLLVYEAAAGAFSAKPEEISIPAEATSLALGQLDDSYEMDLAVAAGRELLIVHGRDRSLRLDEAKQGEVRPAAVDRRAFRSVITSLAIGDFTGKHDSELALLTADGRLRVLSQAKAEGERQSQSVKYWKDEVLASGYLSPSLQLMCTRMTTGIGDDLILVDPMRHQLRVLTSKSSSRGPAELRTRAVSSHTRSSASFDMDGQPVVALPMRLNGDALSDLVILRSSHSNPAFAITAPQSLIVVSSTSDTGAGSLREAINTANASPGVDTISFNIPGPGTHTINLASVLPTITETVIVDGTTQPGFVGTPLIQLNGAAIGGAYVLSLAAGNCTVRALILDSLSAIRLASSGNVVATCYLQGGIGIESGSNNRIGGTTSADRNVISGTVGLNGAGTTGNQVQGNYIGTDATGTAAMSNTADGVIINSGAQNNTIGGATASARNVVSSHDEAGILLSESGNLVQGNYIGTKVDGTTALPGQYFGIWVINSSSNTIGGTTPSARNIISGNNTGISINITASGVLVQGNYIGLGANGNTTVSNSTGVLVSDSPNNTIGGTGGARNVISGNSGSGVVINSGTTSNLVQGNYIGTDATGALARPNSTGISVDASNNTIGGTGATGNVISGNSGNGIDISSDSTGIVVQGNFIGTTANGISALGNGGAGVFINGSGNTVGKSYSGGTLTGTGNTIAFNGFNGITAGLDTINTLVGNSIFSNKSTAPIGPLPIEIFPEDITTYVPILDSASVSGGNTTVTGHVDPTTPLPYYIVLYSFSECTGQTPGGGSNPGGNSQQLTTQPILRNTVSFSITLTGVTPAYGFVNGQAIVNNIPGEYGNCLVVGGTSNPVSVVTSLDPGSAAIGTAAFTLTVNGSNFISGSVVRFNGNNRSTSFISATQLTADILASDVSVSGSFPITVFNPAPGGGLSNPFNFMVTTCSFSLNPTIAGFSADGGAGFVNVTTGVGCNWTAVSNDPNVVMITSGTNYSGSQTVSYSVTTNTASARSRTMTIAGQTFTVNQASGCSFFFNPDSQNFTVGGGSGGFSLITQASCAWMATRDVSWITITSGSGSSSGTVSFTIMMNPGPARSGTITVADQSFTVTQDGNPCTFMLDRTSQSFAANGGTGGVNVTAASGCTWTAVSNSPFLTINSGASGNGNGPVGYSVNANGGGTIRNGTLTIAGGTFTVYQGIQFTDVPPNNPFYTEIGKLSARGVTVGCGGGNFCPSDFVTREQMSAFIVRALGEFNPPTPASQRFNDVPPSNSFYAFIDRLAALQITLGCSASPPLYCPTSNVTREQMAAFLMRALGEFNPPVPPTQRFNDVPSTNPFYNFIDRLAVLQITLGCSANPPLYCPGDAVTRGQMAAFLVRAFNL